MHRAAHRIQGRSAAPGIALGPLVRLAPVEHGVRQYRSAAEGRQALLDALAASQEDLSALAHQAGDDEAEAILAFQIALLEDDSLNRTGVGADRRRRWRQPGVERGDRSGNRVV